MPPAGAAGDGSGASSERDGRGRIWSQDYQTWIWARPKVGDRFLGIIRVGQSVALRSSARVGGEGCPRGFFAIEPRGFVCFDRTVSLSGETPFLHAVRETMPRDEAFPYDYALSGGAPMYARLPTPAEQRKHEWRYGKAGTWVPLPMFQRGHEQLAVTEPIAPRDPMPTFLAQGGSARGVSFELLRRSIPHGSMLSYTRAFDHGGKTFLLATDLTVVPAERVRAFRRSDFHGIELAGGTRLPIGWTRLGPAQQYRRTTEGRFEPTGATWPIRTALPLAERVEQESGRSFQLVQGEPNELWAAEAELTLVRPEPARPFGVPEGSSWLVVSITQGTLVAYEDLRPVYATLVSPGQGGVPLPGRDHVKYSTTPLGSYRITYKDRAATMSPETGEDRSFWIADVPHTQYFNPPFALHASYWHEQFGQPMSAGCINASPLDAAWLFGWTLPHVPAGWSGATGAGAPENGGATIIVVRR